MPAGPVLVIVMVINETVINGNSTA